ncbi:hypothetical protein Tco_0154951 [Tanacetum coccineum]
MADLKFAETYNLITFLSKPDESDGFKQIVDFLNAHTINYALMVNPTIYTSCIEQLWATVKAKTVNGEVQLQALVDGKKVIITKTSVSRDLHLEDAKVDFLNAHTINYALTVNPTIYTSCIEQFWATAKAKMVNREVQLQALVDGKKVIIIETSVSRDLNATIFEELTRMGYEKLSQKLTFYKAFFSPQWKFLIHTILQCISAKTTAWNKFSSTMASAIICLATNQKFNFSKYIFDSMVRNVENVSGKFLMYLRFVQKKQKPKKPRKDTQVPQPSDPITNVAEEAVNEEDVPTHSNDPLLSGEDRLKLKELMALCTNLQNRVLDLEHIKTTQALEIASLKRRVKKLEKKQRSRTHKLKRLYKVGLSAKVVSSEDKCLGEEDASKQRRKIHDIDVDEDITLDSTHFNIDPNMFRVHDLYGDELFVETKEPVVNAATTTSTIPVSATKDLSNVDMTLAQALAELKNAKPKAVTTTVIITTTAVTRPKAKGLVIQEQEQAPTPKLIVSSLQSSQVKDKGKGIMVEDPLQIKKKDQISFDQQEAMRLQAQFDEESRITREKEEANAALIAQ